MRLSLSIRSPGWGAVALSAARFGFACTFSEGKKRLLLCAHKTRAGTHTHTHTHTPSHTHTHSYTQCGNKPYAKCTRDHMHIHTHQMQLMPTSRSRNVLVVSPRHVVSRVCFLLYMSSYIAGRRSPNLLSFKSRLNYTCGVLRSINLWLRGQGSGFGVEGSGLRFRISGRGGESISGIL